MDPILVVSPAKTYKSQRKRAGYRKDAKSFSWQRTLRGYVVSEISINWDIRVKEKLSALAALGTAGSKWRQYWFCITPDKRYTFFHFESNDSFVYFYKKYTTSRSGAVVAR